MSKVTSSVKEEVSNLSEIIKTGLTLDSNGVGSQAEGADLYNKNLPEGLTKDVVKAVSDYNTTFVAAGVQAFGELSVAAMAADKTLDKTSLELPIAHHDTLNVAVQREKTFANRLSGDGADVVKQGVTTVSIDVRGAHKAGELKKARDYINQLASSKF